MTHEPAPRAPEDAQEIDPPPPRDPLRRAVHILLAIWLLPAVLLVIAVATVAAAIEAAVRGVRRGLGWIANRLSP